MPLTSVAEIAREPVVLEPADRRAEQETSTWWLGMAEADRAAGFRGAATCYVRHDPQAGQLRCSTGSVAADALPFRAAYAECDDLGPVVEAFLADRAPGVIGWADLAEARGGGEGAAAARPAVRVRGVGTVP
ncbi:hypothetical protein [Streptomyces sp. NPDC051016]|uniref:hypothetical protein n=1 Tax=Streptomyces sp. NPDC051016 TaxID=3365638 RepID=UPI0037BA29CB